MTLAIELFKVFSFGIFAIGFIIALVSGVKLLTRAIDKSLENRKKNNEVNKDGS